MMTKKTVLRLLSLILLCCTANGFAACCKKNDHLHLYDHPTPYLGDGDLPCRNPPIEVGDPMLGPGKISRPCVDQCHGTVLNPRLWIYGLIRTTLQAFRTGNDDENRSEWANRIDLFANLQLTGTDRVLLHMRPLNKNACFTSYVFTPHDHSGYRDNFTANITQLFYEGDLGDLFPHRQAQEPGPIDIGFAIGRQLIFFQDGIFINDFVDGLAITQNSLTFPCISNLQVAAYVGVNNIDRDDNRPERGAVLVGLHSRIDLSKRTLDLDAAYVISKRDHREDHEPDHDYDSNYDYEKGDVLVLAASSVQRIGSWGVTARALGSIATTKRTRQSGDGLLLYLENNTEIGPTHDIFYINAAAAFGEFTSVARDATGGGPLGRVGVLFATSGIGDIGSAIDPRANDCVAAAIGYQKFVDLNWQGILELGARVNTCTSFGDVVALGLRVQRGIGCRCVLRFDFFGGARNHLEPAYGARMEFIIKI